MPRWFLPQGIDIQAAAAGQHGEKNETAPAAKAIPPATNKGSATTASSTATLAYTPPTAPRIPTWKSFDEQTPRAPSAR